MSDIAAAAPAADPGAPPSPASDALPPADAGSWAAPDFVPEAFRKASAEETLAELAKGYEETHKRVEGLREKLAKAEKVTAPKSVDEYTFEPSEALKPYFGENDMTKGMMDAVKAAALEIGVPADKFGTFIESVHKPLIEQGLLPAPINPKAEIDTFAKVMQFDDQATSERLTQIDQFAAALVGEMDLPGADPELVDAARFQIQQMTETSAGNLALNFLMERLQGAGAVPTGGKPAGGAMTKDEVARLSADPRINPANRNETDPAKRFDPALRQRYDAWFAQNAPDPAG